MKKADTKLKKKTRPHPAKARTRSTNSTSHNGHRPSPKNLTAPPIKTNAHGIPDYRLETTPCSIVREWMKGELRYQASGDLKQPVPPLRESRYLNKEQSLEIYRYMLTHRRLEETLEVLYKQSKVVGGVYFGLGQEGCSVAAAYALDKDDWLGPMIRNQGAVLVRGFRPRDTMLQYMAKAGSPTRGRDGASAY